MAARRVFLSYDYDNDLSQYNLLVGQSKYSDSPFTLADWSVKAHIDGDWKAKVRERMSRVDIVCILCGKNMNTATGVNAEVEIAQSLGKPYFFLAAYVEGSYLPKAAKPNDKLYSWTWQNLKSLIGGDR